MASKKTTANTKKKKGVGAGKVGPIVPIHPYSTVPLLEAIEGTLQWCTYNAGLNAGDSSEFIRAFYLPKSDIYKLHAMMEANTDINGCRLYLAINPGVVPSGINRASDLRLLAVAVEDSSIGVNGADILDVGGQSAIFDFSCPCPPTCDANSPLHHSVSVGTKKQNKKRTNKRK